MAISLADAPRALKKLHGARITYRQLYLAVLDGRVPAERADNGRWQLAENDLPAIVQTLGARVRSPELPPAA